MKSEFDFHTPLMEYPTDRSGAEMTWQGTGVFPGKIAGCAERTEAA